MNKRLDLGGGKFYRILLYKKYSSEIRSREIRLFRLSTDILETYDMLYSIYLLYY